MNSTPFTLAFICLTLAAASANDTSLHEGSWGPEPIGGPDGPESPVRMIKEALHIKFGKETTQVAATFTFRNNLSSTALEQLVGFPDIGAAEKEQLRRDREKDPKASFEGVNSTGPLLEMTTLINGSPRISELSYGAIALDKNSFPMPWRDGKGETTRLMAWHALKVTFPPGEDVTVERRYRVTNGWQIYDIDFFNYTTATGGVWQGTIGQLTADVELLDGLTVDELAWDDDTLPKIQQKGMEKMSPVQRNAWQIVSPTHLRLKWTDFEPRTEKEHRGFTIARKAQKIPKADQAEE